MTKERYIRLAVDNAVVSAARKPGLYVGPTRIPQIGLLGAATNRSAAAASRPADSCSSCAEPMCSIERYPLTPPIRMHDLDRGRSPSWS